MPADRLQGKVYSAGPVQPHRNLTKKPKQRSWAAQSDTSTELALNPPLTGVVPWMAWRETRPYHILCACPPPHFCHGRSHSEGRVSARGMGVGCVPGKGWAGGTGRGWARGRGGGWPPAKGWGAGWPQDSTPPSPDPKAHCARNVKADALALSRVDVLPRDANPACLALAPGPGWFSGGKKKAGTNLFREVWDPCWLQNSSP